MIFLSICSPKEMPCNNNTQIIKFKVVGLVKKNKNSFDRTAAIAQCILDRTVGDLSVKTPGEPSGVV